MLTDKRDTMPGPPTPPSTGAGTTTEQKPKPGLYLNWENWLPHFEDDRVSLADKKKQFEALWSIAMCFSDMDYDLLGPDDVADKETCGQVIDLKATLEFAVVNLEASRTQLKAKKEEV